MTPHRLPVLALALSLALGLAPASAGPAEEAPAPAQALVLPFAHRVGARFGLRIERERREPGSTSHARAQVADVQVLSPYGRDLLVELRWRVLEVDGRALELEPRRAETAAGLDQLGGGRWLLRVDVHGSARALLNAEEVQAGYARAGGRPLEAGAWQAALADLLDVWNVVYAACGVPLVPSAERTTWVGEDGVVRDAPDPGVASDEALAPGQLHDVRVLRLEGDAQRVTALAVHARTRLSEGALAVPVERTAATRYDLATRRLSGWQLSVRRRAEGRDVERVAFEELAPPAPPARDQALAAAR